MTEEYKCFVENMSNGDGLVVSADTNISADAFSLVENIDCQITVSRERAGKKSILIFMSASVENMSGSGPLEGGGAVKNAEKMLVGGKCQNLLLYSRLCKSLFLYMIYKRQKFSHLKNFVVLYPPTIPLPVSKIISEVLYLEFWVNICFVSDSSAVYCVSSFCVRNISIINFSGSSRNEFHFVSFSFCKSIHLKTAVDTPVN